MKEIKRLERTNEDFNNFEDFLLKNDLLDERLIWFAGFDDSTRGAQNAVARNLLYGNKNLMCISIKDDDIYLIRNRKSNIQVDLIGSVQEKYDIKIHRNIIYPSIELHLQNDKSIYLQATKNKQMMKEFKKVLKKS